MEMFARRHRASGTKLPSQRNECVLSRGTGQGLSVNCGRSTVFACYHSDGEGDVDDERELLLLVPLPLPGVDVQSATCVDCVYWRIEAVE